MEALPDLTTLTDDNLRDLIRRLSEEENEVSYRRRLLHGKIDILRAELVTRLQKQVGDDHSSTSEVNLERLTEILASKTSAASNDKPVGGANA